MNPRQWTTKRIQMVNARFLKVEWQNDEDNDGDSHATPFCPKRKTFRRIFKFLSFSSKLMIALLLSHKNRQTSDFSVRERGSATFSLFSPQNTRQSAHASNIKKVFPIKFPCSFGKDAQYSRRFERTEADQKCWNPHSRKEQRHESFFVFDWSAWWILNDNSTWSFLLFCNRRMPSLHGKIETAWDLRWLVGSR